MAAYPEAPRGLRRRQPSRLRRVRQAICVVAGAGTPRRSAGGGLNIAHEAIDRHVLAGRGKKLALRWIGRDDQIRDYSYSALGAAANRFANVLVQHGVARGDRVFSLLGRVPELYIAAFGTLKNGSVFSPLFSAFGPEPIEARMTIGNAKALITLAAIGNGIAFARGRDFAAWLGLVPKQMSTGDRTILGRITKRGNRYLRTLFMQGARVILLRPINWAKHSFTREFVVGTGKYEGMVTDGTVEPLGPFPVIKAGTFQDCNYQTGTYKLKYAAPAVAYRVRSGFDQAMTDTRTISQLEAEGYPWIGCECCKGTVWVLFNMIREKIPALSSWSLDELGAKMKCDRCGKRPERSEAERRAGICEGILRGLVPMRVGYLKVFEGQNSSTRTIAQTIPHPIHVMFGWAACHSKTLL
jgi:hypothetical protein